MTAVVGTSPAVETPAEATARPSAGRAAYRLDHLDHLEAEAIHVVREVAGQFERPVILFSGGKDSVVMLHLAVKAFAPSPLPFALLHVDTGHNFPEVLDYRDATVARLGVRLVVASVQDYIDDGRLRERPDGTRNPLQTVPLLDAISGRLNLFVRSDEQEQAWTWVMPVLDAWANDPAGPRPYASGSWGPAAASALVARDGCAWAEEE